MPLTKGFRRVVPDFGPFHLDLEGDDAEDVFDRAEMLNAANDYLRTKDLAVDWSAVETIPDDELVSALSMLCPFEPPEKQALLESAEGVRTAAKCSCRCSRWRRTAARRLSGGQAIEGNGAGRRERHPREGDFRPARARSTRNSWKFSYARSRRGLSGTTRRARNSSATGPISRIPFATAFPSCCRTRPAPSTPTARRPNRTGQPHDRHLRQPSSSRRDPSQAG